MNPMLKASVAVLIAALSFAPATSAFAAISSASLVTATKTDVVPVGDLVNMVGAWKPENLAMFDKATSVKVFDTRTLYQAADLTKIGSAETSKAADITKLRDALRADANLKAWFDQHKIDIGKVIAVNTSGSAPEIFTY